MIVLSSNINQTDSMNVPDNNLLFINQLFIRYFLGLLFFLGIISITLNTIIFRRRTFRTTSCIHYFLASSYANILIIYFVIPCRYLADGFNIDPSKTSLVFCKIREYILTVSRSLSAWFLVLASFDRLMSSSHEVRYRRFCHIHIVKRMILLTIIVHLIFYLHILILFTNQTYLDQCNASTGIYRIINDCIYAIFYIILPASLMLIFGLLTINKRKNRFMIPTVRSLHIIKRERNLFLMFIFQFVLFTFTTFPHAIGKLYVTLTIDKIQDDYNQLIFYEFYIRTARTISFITHACQFYVLTLSSKLFRNELKKIFHELFRHQQRQIEKLHMSNINLSNNQLKTNN